MREIFKEYFKNLKISRKCIKKYVNFSILVKKMKYIMQTIYRIFLLPIITVIGSLYSIIITFELRSSISAQDIYAQSQKFSALYGHSSGSKALDNLQQYYMCCGGIIQISKQFQLILAIISYFFKSIFFIRFPFSLL